ncbi:efflux RND transporter periplasmic adaptor subunit [Acetobacter sp. AN02]|uniref:efflux RND transporter periplasmic adaptor subunit n=1 Tax=Acetobacter sp. AN02 TaxID=2894186 RepID=UPI00243445AA|nr:efflux RND transporter periplasmic adaptor subunit [Acetobacter sp. AN02]MDG6094189.1 efflux RND transporter periplasmic adaptor subunit [Acetobacter sp. AN02]
MTPLLLSAVSLLALTACEKKAAKPPPPPPQTAEFITVSPRAVHVTTELPGRISSYEIAMVRPQVNGVIQKRLFTEGTDVVAGQQLYQIDPRVYQAAYDSASGQLAQAKANAFTARAKFERYGPLVKAHAVSKQEYDDARAASDAADAQVLIAKGQVENAAVNLNYTQVRAPITGRIGRSLQTVGALVATGQAANLSVITRLDPIYVDVNLPAVSLLRLREEVASGRIQTGDDKSAPVSLKMEDGTTYKDPGKIQFNEVNVDQATATVVVRAVFPNPDHLLLPGMYVHASLDEGINPDAILVPQQALFRNTRAEPEVMVLDSDNKASIRNVTTGPAHGTDWIITDGLKPGDRVVVTGLQKIHPGDKVNPQPYSEDTSAPADRK